MIDKDFLVILIILKQQCAVIKVDYKNSVFGVVGSEGEVGKPLVHELMDKNAKQIIRLDKRNPEYVTLVRP